MTPERVAMNEAGADHQTQLGYYGGRSDGRRSIVGKLHERDLGRFDDANHFGYTVTRYGVHTDNHTLCWVLLTHTPIAERGNL